MFLCKTIFWLCLPFVVVSLEDKGLRDFNYNANEKIRRTSNIFDDVIQIVKDILRCPPPAPLSEIPSKMPSQLPTTAPTFFPSEMPSEMSSQVPSQMPSEVLSAAPTPAPRFDKQILAPDAASWDQFGQSVGIHGENIVVGAPYDNDNGSSSGSIYIFSTNGSLEEKVTASDGESRDYFGSSVAVSENFIVVGANGHNSSRGAAYIIPLNDTSSMVKIVAPDGEIFDSFGYSAAISGNVIAIGAPSPFADDVGAAYLFATNGTFIQKLSSSDGANGDNFGNSVAVTDDVVVVGAYRHDDSTGAAYVFNTGNGEFLTKLEPLFRVEDGRFGVDISVFGETIVVGTKRESAYIYGLDGTLIQQIFSPLSIKVAVSENVVVVGGSGSVLLFTTEGLFIEKIDDPDEACGLFGSDLSIEGNRLVVGARFGEDDKGDAYVYLI